MDILTLWDEIKAELAGALPRVSYETWVRDTQAIGLDDGVLRVRARNVYARDWLSARLGEAVLTLAQEKGVEARAVEFVVEPPVKADEEAGGDEGENAADAKGAGEGEVEVEAGDYESLYEQAVRPERAVYLPGYFRRWLPLLGPDLGWFYVGFRQAAYLAGGRSEEKSGRFSGKQIAALCGVTERTFWNRVGRAATWRKLEGLLQRNGSRYRVALTLPLTAADVRALTAWLAAHVEECGGALGAIEAACQAPVEALLASTPTEEAEGFRPASVVQALRQVFPELGEGELRGAAERLRLHLMPPSDQIVVSLFFLEHVLPHLGAGPAWLYILLRDRCYVGTEHVRSVVVAPGGYRELASWLGISRPRTIYDYLREPIAQVYLAARRLEGDGDGDKWDNPLSIRVLLEDIPPELVQAAANYATWEEAARTLSRLGLVAVSQTEQGGDAIFSGGEEAGDAIFSIQCRDFQCPVTRFSVFGDAIFSVPVTRFSVFGDAIFSVLNRLNRSVNLLKPLVKPNQPAENAPILQNASPESVGRFQGGVDESAKISQKSGTGWDYEGILERMGVNPATRGRLQQEGVGAQFIAWWLQALTMRGVDAVRVAIAWSLDPRKRDGAGKDFCLLAANPARLREIARGIASGRFCPEYEGGRLDREVWAEKSGDAVYQCYLRLFGRSPQAAGVILQALFGEGVRVAVA